MKPARVKLWMAGAGLAGILAAGLSAPVQPQQPPGTAAPPAARAFAGIEEVVVTARRREENLQDVPIAITSLSGEFLEENAVGQLSDLARYAPSLRVENFNSMITTNVGIRGIRATDIAPGQDSTVGVYVAEVNYGYTIGISQQMFDLQAIEVVKGPQGTLFGRNTTGGALLVTPAKPGGALEGSVMVGSTFFDGGNGFYTTDVLNVPVSEQLKLRAGVHAVTRDGFVRNLATEAQSAYFNLVPLTGPTDFKRVNDDGSVSWRLSALYEPTDNVESYLLYQGTRLRTNGIGYSINAVNPDSFTAMFYNTLSAQSLPGSQVPSALETLQRRQTQQADDFWTIESNLNTFDRLDMHAVSDATTWNLSDTLRVKNVAGYRHFDRASAIDIDGLPIQVAELQPQDEGDEFSEELQMQGSTSDQRLSWVAGLFYSGQHIQRESSYVVLATPPELLPLGVPPSSRNHSAIDSDNSSYAAFAQGTLKIPGIEGLSLTAGARYTRDIREMTSSLNAVAGPAPGCRLEGLPADSPCELHGKKTYNEPTYTVSLDYKIDDDTLVYAAHRRGYRSGGFNYLATSDDSFGPFDPEFVTDFEVGLKKDWMLGESVLRTNLAAYYSDYKDIQRFLVLPGATASSVVNAQAHIWGGELELTYIAALGFEVSGSYAWTRPEYDDFVVEGLGDFTDNRFAQAPREQYSIAAKYRLPLDASVGDISLRGDFSRQSHIFYLDTAQGPSHGPYASQGQEGFGMLNLGVSWESILSSKFDASLYVKNVTNEETKPFGFMIYESLGFNTSTIGDPRVFGLELRYRFGR